MKFRVKVLLADGNNHTEVADADSPTAANAVAFGAMKSRGMEPMRALTIKKVKGESNYEAPNIDDVGRLFGGNVSRVVRNH